MFVFPDLPQPALRLPKFALAGSFFFIVQGLYRAIAARCATDRAMQPIALLVGGWLCPAALQFFVLFKHWREGNLPAARKRPEHADQDAREDDDEGEEIDEEEDEEIEADAEPVTRPRLSLPRGFAWLVKRMPEAAVYGSQLQHLLADPDMAAFLSEVPQAGRILRPLCRMLGVQLLPQLRRRPTAETHASHARHAEREESATQPPSLSSAHDAPRKPVSFHVPT